jgi:hypothetical protein
MTSIFRMACWIVPSLIGVLAVAGPALAQKGKGKGHAFGHNRPVVVSPPNLNPTVLRSTTPFPTRIIPGTYVPPTVAPGFWGPTALPGSYTPPYVVQRDPGQYLRQSNGMYWNPWTNGAYSPYSNTFHFPGQTYSYNPWTGNYSNWLSGAQYDPGSGILARPVLGSLFTDGFYNPWLFR